VGKDRSRSSNPSSSVNKYDFLDFALADEELLTTIEEAIRAGGGRVTRD